MSLVDKLRKLQSDDPETFSLVQQLAQNARNPDLDPEVRIRCATVLGNTFGPLLLEDIREELNKEVEPRYEFRYIRGAKVKVRVN